MKKIRTFIAAFILVATSAFVFAPVYSVAAQGALDAVCNDNPDSAVCRSENKDATADNLVATIVNTLLFVVGAISVIMVIVGGIFYVTSHGDSGNITKAKNTILYAIVGMIVAFLAYAIINWVFRIF